MCGEEFGFTLMKNLDCIPVIFLLLPLTGALRRQLAGGRFRIHSNLHSSTSNFILLNLLYILFTDFSINNSREKIGFTLMKSLSSI